MTFPWPLPPAKCAVHCSDPNWYWIVASTKRGSGAESLLSPLEQPELHPGFTRPPSARSQSLFPQRFSAANVRLTCRMSLVRTRHRALTLEMATAARLRNAHARAEPGVGRNLRAALRSIASRRFSSTPSPARSSCDQTRCGLAGKVRRSHLVEAMLKA